MTKNKEVVEVESEVLLQHFVSLNASMLELAKIIKDQFGCTNVSCSNRVENLLLNNINEVCPFSKGNNNISVCYVDFGDDQDKVEVFIEKLSKRLKNG